jgi:hypothetical protein
MKTLLLVAVTASLAACGGETPAKSGAASPQEANKQALLDYARCMRQNGVNMPDPKFEGNRVMMQQGGPGLNPDTMRAAQKACQKYQDAVKPPAMSDDDKAQFKQAALANARCMREHGLPNFPDPTFDANGGAQIKLGRGNGVDPQSPKFKAAMEACKSTLPFGGKTAEDGQ